MTLHENGIPPEAEEDFAAWVAIDWADQKHVWALQETGSSRRQQGEIEASPEAVDAWVSELLLRFPGRRIAVALEQKRGALLCLLSKYAALVLYPVHPATVSRMRAALYPSNSKDDPKDADLLLDILLYHRKHLRRLDADTVETRKLQILVEEPPPAGGPGNRLRQPVARQAEAVLPPGATLAAGSAGGGSGRISAALADASAAAEVAAGNHRKVFSSAQLPQRGADPEAAG